MPLTNPSLSPEYAALAAVATDWMERVWRRRDLAAISELHAPDFCDRSPAGRDPGLAAYAAGVAELFAAFPDFEATTDDLVAV
ncbi:MAG TPA: ester cyclase, partial [Acidobacteriota bacterium]|nr:ester cyclase [Acidobacteriota bacterium]